MGKYLEKYIDQFHQDILTINDTFEDAIKEALGGLEEADQEHLKAELQEISENADAKFSEIWNGSRSPFKLRNEREAREILDEILALL
jgi:DnaJ-class molecular chaperone